MRCVPGLENELGVGGRLMRQAGHWEGVSADLEVLTHDHGRVGDAWEPRPLGGGQMGVGRPHRVLGLQEGPGSDPALLILETVSQYRDSMDCQPLETLYDNRDHS